MIIVVQASVRIVEEYNHAHRQQKDENPRESAQRAQELRGCRSSRPFEG